MVFFMNTTQGIGLLVANFTLNNSGSMLLTMFLILFVIVLLALVFRLPMELLFIFLLPLGIVFISFPELSATPLGVIILLLNAGVMVKYWFFSR